MIELDQKDRTLTITTPLGKNKLVLTSMRGEERISDLFRFDLDLLSTDGNIDPKSILGKNVTFSVVSPEHGMRHFNGIVTVFGHSGQTDRTHTYHMVVRPTLWKLTLANNWRMHATEKTARDVVDDLLSELGVGDVEWDLSGTPRTREYVVQYGESHYDFIHRLMAEEGIYFYFRHEDGKHALVFCDKADGGFDCLDYETHMPGNKSAKLVDNIISWQREYEYTPGKAAQTDYDFTKPSTSLLATKNSLVSLEGNDALEVYTFPGGFTETGESDGRTGRSIEGREAGFDTVSGSSHCRSYSPGATFEITEHHVEAEKGKRWMVTSVRHEADLGGAYVTGGDDVGSQYHNWFTAQPAAVPFRPEQAKPKPRVMGPQTAVVTGPAGEEIYTDEHGRVKVQFPWDRLGSGDETSSFWVRVSTPWAGSNWGMVHIPRIGQEVVVSFLNGDPDYPLITGMVYNAENMPPYALPDNMTQSGVKSRSSKGGSADHFNEIRFEDKKDAEEIYVHAEKDFNAVIENNETRRVGFEDMDAGDQTLEVYNHQSVTVGEGSGSGNQTVTVQQHRSTTLNAGNDSLEVARGNRDVSIKMGNETYKLDLGKSEKEAMQSIELKVGSNSIKIDQTGITLSGIMVNVEGTGMCEVKAPMTTVKGDGMLTLRGGMTMIN